MKKLLTRRWKFFLRIIFPALLAVILFTISFYLIILPEYERSIMDKKAEMIGELTATAVSIFERYHSEVLHGRLSDTIARREAIEQVRHLRYGAESKDYFWITDTFPRMVMHPYREELNGKDLSDFQDPSGKRLFVECIRTVRQSPAGAGYVEYMWQWKDDSTLIVPKLSFVKAFRPWGWVIGTGIYLEDVQSEINNLERGLLLISLGIMMILLVLMVIITFQGYRIETRRLLAEKETLKSEEKYRELLDAATEGTLMILGEKIVYTNKLFQNLSGFHEQEIQTLGLPGIFRPEDAEIILKTVSKPDLSKPTGAYFETELIKKNHETTPVRQSFPVIPYGGELFKVIKIETLTSLNTISGVPGSLLDELQSSVLFLKQPVSAYLKMAAVADLELSIKDSARKMTDTGCDAILITTEHGITVGIVTDRDIRIRAVSTGISFDKKVHEIMSSPLIVITETALLYEAVAKMQECNVSHLAVRNSAGQICGIVSANDLLKAHQYSFSFTRQEIEKASSIGVIRQVTDRIPALANILINSGADPVNLVRLTSVVFETTAEKLISMALTQLGDPPVSFTFISLGSAGREEQTLATDQDHAIIFEDVDEERLEETRQWFMRFGKLISDWLNDTGYHYCPGKIMASNPEWCQPLSRWKQYFTRWITSAEPQDLLDVNIFFDFRSIYGKTALSDELRTHIQETIRRHPSFFIFMTGNIQKMKPPIGLFGQIVVGLSKEQPDVFDIKKVMLPLVDMIRLYALKEGFRETNTLVRLYRLHQAGVFTDTQYQDRQEAYKHLLLMRFRHQAGQIAGGGRADNYINPERIPEIEKALLKKIFVQLSEFTGKLTMDFKSGLT